MSIDVPAAPAERTALKEWKVLCDAMGQGDIIAMVRKGGIREQRAGFTVRHERFLLYPTFFHEKAIELQPRFRERLRESHVERPVEGLVRLELVAHVAAVWPVSELEPLRMIEASHGLAWPAVESRFRYRDRPGVQLVATRVHRLRAAVELPEQRRYQGCVSWVALDEGVEVRDAEPVLDDATFERRLQALRAVLGAARDDEHATD